MVSARVEEPDEIVKQMNNSMSEMNENSLFVTLFVGNLDLKTGILSYCNAGHCPPVLMGSDISTIKMDSNIPIGVMSGWDYTRQEILVESDSTIFIYTDGLTEAEDSTHGQFGEARLLAELEKLRSDTPRALIEHMSEVIRVFEAGTERSDDLTMLAIKYTKTS